MQKLETRSGTLAFIEVPENAIRVLLEGSYLKYWFVSNENHKDYRYAGKFEGEFELLGEVTKEGITFDCKLYIEHFILTKLGLYNRKRYILSTFGVDYFTCENGVYSFLSLMKSIGIELTEGKTLKL